MFYFKINYIPFEILIKNIAKNWISKLPPSIKNLN